jgi:serine/threonine protein phosphatase PrpC
MVSSQPSPSWVPNIRSASRTHCGKVRVVNEDRVLLRPEAGIWAVADGMGGHRAGDYAAQQCVDALEQVTLHGSAFRYLNSVLEAIGTVNATLFSQSRLDPQLSGMGATLVTLLAYDAHLACIWAGDSRAYRWRRGVLEQLTSDHSLVQGMIDRGEIEASDRGQHPQSHVVTRAVGAFPTVELDKAFSMIVQGDKFLICSDGLTNSITNGALADQLAAPLALSDQADAILQAAMETEASDNISFVLLHT